MATTLKYDMIGAHNAGVRIDPREQIAKLGMKVLLYEPVLMGDFAAIQVNQFPADLPNYITPFFDWKFTPAREEEIKFILSRLYVGYGIHKVCMAVNYEGELFYSGIREIRTEEFRSSYHDMRMELVAAINEKQQG